MNELKKARVRATGRNVQVYFTKRGTWCDYADCTTEYTSEELEFV